MSEALVSVIIPTYNRAEMLCKCVATVLQSSYSNYEIIIVDNASTDSTVERLESTFRDERLHIVRLQKNMMAAGGRNAGIKVAKGDYYLFLDNDNYIEENMIKNLVAFFEEHDEAGLVAPISLNRVKDELVIWMLSGDYYLYSSKPKVVGSNLRYEGAKLKEYYDTIYAPNCFMVKKEAIQKVGGLDPVYYAMYEEADFGYRIHNAGYKNYIISNAITYHQGYVGVNENQVLRRLGVESPERAKHFARNRSIFEKKYANWKQLIPYMLFYVHLYNWAYTIIALKEKRPDIAWAYFSGGVQGIFARVERKIKVDI